MVVNYRLLPVGPIIAFLAFVLILLIGMPVWALHHFGEPHGPLAGKLIIAPIIGLFWLLMIVRTFRFNARVRRDPRALQWDSLGLSLWQDDRTERVQWPQVGDVSIQPPGRPSNPSVLKIGTKAADGSLRRWRFTSTRLQLAGQPLAGIAEQIERARNGDAVPASVPASVGAARVDSRLSDPRYEQRVAAVRTIGVVVLAAYFITLAGMIIHLSSNTMLLTPHDPLLWFSAKVAFLATAAAILYWYLKTLSSVGPISWRVALWFLLGRVMVPGLTFSAMIGLWAWLAANVYVTDKTWGGHIEHGAVLMMIDAPMITHNGRPNVEAHLINRPGQSVFFTIDAADAELLRRSRDPAYVQEAACLTVPVQWTGYAIRSEITTETPLPQGSLSACS